MTVKAAMQAAEPECEAAAYELDRLSSCANSYAIYAQALSLRADLNLLAC